MHRITKTPLERFYVGVNFSPDLDAGELVTTSGSTCTQKTNPASGATLFEDGSLTIGADGKTMLVRVSGGISGDVATIEIAANTDKSNVYTGTIEITVS